MRKLLALLVIVVVSHSAFAEDPVHFADANLKVAVEAQLGISDPTPTDMLGLISLNADRKNITDITGLEYATNLTSLWLEGNQLSDISSLSGLTNLRTLHLQNNQLSDISSLSGLTKLRDLNIKGNPLNSPSYDIYIPLIKTNNPEIDLHYNPR